jgi:hypothetical protein
MSEKIENLAYRLQLSNHWRIHSIIFVAQLESIADSIKDSYSRSRFEESDFVKMKDDTQNVKSFEIKRLINKRIIAREIEYLLRWKDYDSQWNEWRNLEKLHNASNLIQNYETFMNNVIFYFRSIITKHFNHFQFVKFCFDKFIDYFYIDFINFYHDHIINDYFTRFSHH